VTSRRRRARGERGASLILAIVFMVVVGGVSLVTLSYITNGTNQRRLLEHARNREYAADGTIEQAIARVRGLPAPGPAVAPCGGPDTHSNFNGYDIQVDCQNAPTLTTSGLLQRNVIFTACEVSRSSRCTDSSTIVRAQVNFQTQPGPGQTVVTRTWVQSWSVNR
jgi:hypothetical protein